jgi:hypothetical protein
MLLLLLLIGIYSAQYPISTACLQKDCYYPFIFHNFTNCYEDSTREDSVSNITCTNQANYECTFFRANGQNNTGGYVQWGDIMFKMYNCNIIQDIFTIEMWVETNHTEWEIRPHNIILTADTGTISFNDQLGNTETCSSCYNDTDGVRAIDLLYIVARMNYTHSPNVNYADCFGLTTDCQMTFELFINGSKVSNSTNMIMHKYFSESFPAGEEFRWVRQMIADTTSYDTFQKIYFTAAWNAFLTDAQITTLYALGLERTTTDSVCVEDLCEISDLCDEALDAITDTNNSELFDIWTFIYIFFFALFCGTSSICCIFCIFFGFLLAKREKEEEEEEEE